MILLSLCLLLAAYLCSMVLLFLVGRTARRLWHVVPCVVLAAVDLLALVGVLALRGSGALAVPGWVPVGSCVLLFVGVLGLVLCVRRSRRVLSGMSIRESTDKVPLGLCFYYPNGMPILINSAMQRLATALTGSPVRNAAAFADSVAGQTLPVGAQYYRFTVEDLQCGGEQVRRLCAVDITALHQLALDLDAENARRKEMNRRLQAYSHRVEALTRDEEVLHTKMDIHDKMGRMLLETKIYLESDGKDSGPIVERWRRTLAVFGTRHWNRKPTPDVQSLFRIAADMHLALHLEGTPTAPVFLAAVRECITNAVRHGGASNLWVRLDGSVLTVTNDGCPPAGPITEGGGLTDLRRKVERLGGSMEIVCAPRFQLQIKL